MTRTAATLSDIIATLNDGISFYAHAAAQAQVPAHRELFAHLRELKTRIVDELAREVVYQGESPPTDGTWLNSVREGYADLRARLGERPDAAYVAALEEQEDRILAAFREAYAASQPARVRDLAGKYLPQVQQSHDRLRDLKRALAA